MNLWNRRVFGIISGLLLGRAESVNAQTSKLGLSTTAIARRAVPASVTIVALDARGDTLAFGSGFFVRADGIVVTNYHVLAGATRALIVRANGEILDRVSVLDADPASDLAILKATVVGVPALTLAAGTPSVGQKIVVVGAPLGLEHTVSEGIVSAVRIESGRERIQMSAPISSGSSGGPVINANLGVIGVTRATIASGQSLNFAIPARYVIALLADAAGAKAMSVEAVFATATSRQDQPTGNTRLSTNKSALVIPRPSAPRNGALIGTFHTKTEVTYASNAAPDSVVSGILVLPESGNGFWKPRHTGQFVMPASDAVNTATGRVGVKVGRISLEGWVTEGGFYMAGQDLVDRTSLQFTASPVDLPLASAIGIYDVAVRTSYRKGDYVGTPREWTGVVSVMTNSDSVWMDIDLRNASGGSTGAYLRTTLDGTGNFAWSNDTKAASGVVRNGRVEIEWTDRREGNAVYRGLITGARR